MTIQSAWSDADAAAAVAKWGSVPGSNEDVALRVYTSRLIGSESTLVLHGGGNTSVKTRLPDDLGEPTDVLCVKGSGWDLGGIEPAGLPAVRLGTLQALRELDSLSDEDMVNAARTRLLNASAPNPSVETLLHAFLPHRFIDHSHADAILALADQPNAAEIAAEVFGDTLAIVDYIMPGFALAKRAVEVYEANRGCQGLLLLQHGLFTFGDSARESYERHVQAVAKAEAKIASSKVSVSVSVSVPSRPEVSYLELAPVLRGRLGESTRRYVLDLRQNDAIRSFVDHPELVSRSGRGPVTPDHVIRTKQLPLVLDPEQASEGWAAPIESALARYRDAYRSYFSRQVETKRVQRTMLDPDPRVVLVPGLGLIGIGGDAKAARVAADLYEHTVSVIESAERVGTYQALPEGDIFDMEYWSLEQAKLGKKAPKPLQGQVVYVTGAGSGIGAATARRFAAAGAHLFVVDRSVEAVQRVAEEIGARWQALDVTDRSAVEASIDEAVRIYGGLDGVVSNAGTAPQAPIDTCPPEVLEGSLSVNLLGHQWVASAAARVMRAQGTGGFLSFNASKAAFNPGRGFGPYAVAKAALVALCKQYALELGEIGVRANAINADRIRTGLLPEDVVARRARARGLEPDAYFRSNLLQREVTADDVAEAFLHLALAPSTTGAVLTVDGGNIAASPR
jgi:rhamnose utilization protein RhaD (predicted bifunctional aldolase and dehydrogenase)/NAD(P)-dependent dehydrogenase (short-subunit alcohol dehydrogenase family)